MKKRRNALKKSSPPFPKFPSVGAILQMSLTQRLFCIHPVEKENYSSTFLFNLHTTKAERVNLIVIEGKGQDGNKEQ